MSKKSKIVSYSVSFHETPYSFVVDNVSNTEFAGFIGIAKPRRIPTRLFTKNHIVTQEECVERGLLINGNKYENNTEVYLGIFTWLWYRLGFSLAKLFFHKEFRRQQERYNRDH